MDAGLYQDTAAVRQAFETPDHIRRIIRYGEYPSVLFGLQRDTVLSKPLHRVAALKTVKRPQELPTSSGIVGDKLVRIKAAMCHIAPAAAGYTDLGQAFAAFFQYTDLQIFSEECEIDRSEKTGGASPDEDGIKMLHPANLRATRF